MSERRRFKACVRAQPCFAWLPTLGAASLCRRLQLAPAWPLQPPGRCEARDMREGSSTASSKPLFIWSTWSCRPKK
eukprot:3334862-Alexandrium_andersonii.AAC.1